MSDFKFNCPHCEQSLEAPEEMLGQTIECPSCHGSIELSKPEPQPQPEPTPKPAPPPAPKPEPAPPPKPETKDCPYCGEEILAKAKKCKHCGEILDTSLQKQSRISSSAAEAAPRKPESEKTEYQSHPSMFRNNPIGFVFALVLIVAAGLGLLILLVWWLKCLGTTLTVTNKKTILRKGILSKHINEVHHADVRNVQVSQGLFQRMFGVGTIGISSAGHAGVEIEVSGLPSPTKIKDIIDRHRRD